MNTRIVIAVIVLAMSASGALAQTKAVPQKQMTPRLQPAPRTPMAPNLKAVPALPGLAVGKRVVHGLDFAAHGFGPPATPRPEMVVKRKVGDGHSALILYGTINMGDIDYFSVSPGFQTQYQMFSDRPRGCQIDVIRLDQSREVDGNYGYKLIYRFWDTATKKECADYFRNLETLTLELRDLQVKYVSVWQRSQAYPAANPGPRVVALPAIEPRDPSGDE